MFHASLRKRLLALGLLLCLAAAVACDRNIEPFDPDLKASEPDLSKIFPAGQAADDERTDLADAPAGASATSRGTAASATSDGAPAGSASAAAISGSVQLADALSGRAPSGAVLFVIARRQGVSSGPPLAVQRIADASLPSAFTIGPENVMIPSMRFEGEIQLTARLDADGNAMTRSPGDLQGSASASVSPGSQNVDIILDEEL